MDRIKFLQLINNGGAIMIRPWYGTWPPELRGDEAMQKTKKELWLERWEILVIMVFVFLKGIVFLLLSILYLQQGSTGRLLLEGFAVALIIAAVLGFTIDRVIRRQLVTDAFKASVGYILPNELKREMEWIYETRILCVQHIQICKLTPIDDEHCKVHVTTQRTFQNISLSKASIDHPGVGIDEWFYKTGSSRILSFEYIKGDYKWHAKDENIKKTDCGWEIKDAEKISLAPKEKVTIYSEIEEIKRMNDANYWAFDAPTWNPEIIVETCDGIRMKVQFGYCKPGELIGSNVYRLTGTLLPNQRIEIRWWKEEDSKRWMEVA
jgi:hypothetical protein